ncbi:MAG: MFS transporter [Oscillospiraceae bacterium]|nr:MFS transporter [Oscillospiraceae bacterium]
MLKKIGQYLGKLTGNAKVCIACHPFWGIPYTIYFYYISMYLLEVGVTDGELGTLMVVGHVAGFLFSLVGAPIVDRMGRRNATFVFDMISSALVPLVYFFTKSFTGALIAQVLFNSSRIMNVAYYLVMIEDEDDECRVVAFNLFNILTIVAGLVMPLAGILVDKYGLVEMERIFLMASFLIMGGMIIVRHMLLKETRVGKAIRERARTEKQKLSVKEMWRPYAEAFRFLLKSKVTMAIVLSNIFFCVYMNLGTNYSLYFVPYFTDRLGMDTMQTSTLGGIYYAGMLLAMICINPLTAKRGIAGSVVLSAVVSLVGMALMIFIPSGIFWLSIVAVMVLAIGYGMLKSGVDGAMAVYSESECRSGIYSINNLLSSGLSLVVTAICATLYAVAPGWLYVLNAIMVVLILVCMLSVRKETAAIETAAE